MLPRCHWPWVSIQPVNKYLPSRCKVLLPWKRVYRIDISTVILLRQQSTSSRNHHHRQHVPHSNNPRAKFLLPSSPPCPLLQIRWPLGRTFVCQWTACEAHLYQCLLYSTARKIPPLPPGDSFQGSSSTLRLFSPPGVGLREGLLERLRSTGLCSASRGERGDGDRRSGECFSGERAGDWRGDFSEGEGERRSLSLSGDGERRGDLEERLLGGERFLGGWP
jgi:hypothetical protein